MKKKVYTIISAALLVLLLAGFPVMAFADGGIKLELPVETIVEGGFPQTPEKFNLVMTAVTENAPMPEGSVDGVYNFTMSGRDNETLTIEFDNLGIYKYTVTQTPGKTSNCHYDKSVYEIVVAVTNAEEGDGRIINVAINRQGHTEKCPKIQFLNKYDFPPNVPTTGDESHIAVWIGVMAVCLVAAVVAIVVIKKKKV